MSENQFFDNFLENEGNGSASHEDLIKKFAEYVAHRPAPKPAPVPKATPAQTPDATRQGAPAASVTLPPARATTGPHAGAQAAAQAQGQPINPAFPGIPGRPRKQKAPRQPRRRNTVASMWNNDNIRLSDLSRAQGQRAERAGTPTVQGQPAGAPNGPATGVNASSSTGYTLSGMRPQGSGNPAQQPAYGNGPITAQQDDEGDDGDHEDDELENLQRFSVYQSPLPFGLDHPDPLVEASSLASCPLPPITYDLKLYADKKVRAKCIDNGALSKAQLEAVIYACQRHEVMGPDGQSRAGYFVGDGAGVGKGRTIAGLVYENFLCGRRKALWVSISADLHEDAKRDLKDIGAWDIPVTNLSTLTYEKISGVRGVLFSTYSSLIAKSRPSAKSKKKVMESRLEQVIDWLGGEDFDGLIVFDESHKAKNLVPPSKKHGAVDSKERADGSLDEQIDLPDQEKGTTDVIQQLIEDAGRGKHRARNKTTKSGGATQTGIVIAAIQERLKKARVVYVSATGVSEIRNLAYMTRLGLWGAGTPFPLGFKQFFDQVDKRGAGAMECIAMDLKASGAYLARTLSYAHSEFSIVPITFDPQILDYDSAALLWLELKSELAMWSQNATQEMQGKQGALMQRQFWSAHQRFFRYLCVASKVPSVVEMAQKALAEGKSVVIGLQNTGESNTMKRLDQEGGELEELVSAPRESITRLIIWWWKNVFHAPDAVLADSDDEDLDLGDSDDEEDEEFGEDSDASSRKAGKKPGRKLIRRESKVKAESKLTSVTKFSDDDESADEDAGSQKADDNESGSGSDFDDKESDESSASEPSAPGKVKAEPVKVKAEPRKGSTITDFFAKRAAYQEDSDGCIMVDSDDEDEPAPRVKAEPKVKAEKRKADSDSETDTEATVKRKFVDDSDDEDQPLVRHRKKLAVQSDDEDSTAPKPKPVPKMTARMRANIKRQLRPLYKLAGGRDKLEAMPFYGSLEKLLLKIEDILLPDNALDQIILGLGGPREVAELTGRKVRAVIDERTGTVKYEKRYGKDKGQTLDNMNIQEKKRFMDDVKRVAVISDAASAGISLQADRRVRNQRRRMHITLELAWAADKTVQQLGRTHRSNQSSAPEYVLVVSDIAGENRFASAVAKRLSSMGALTKGDRKASNGIGLDSFNIETRFGRLALEKTYSAVLGERYRTNFDTGSDKLEPNELPEGMSEETLFEQLRDYIELLDMHTGDKDMSNVTKFLNRILGMPLALQNALFAYYSQNLRFVLAWAKKNNKHDKGIEVIGGTYESLSLAEGKQVVSVYRDPRTGLDTRYWELVSDRGISFVEAKRILDDTEDPSGRDGFYVSSNNEQYQLAIHVGNNMFKLYKPNVGEIYTLCPLSDLKRGYTQVSPEDIQKRWTKRYDFSLNKCTHKLGGAATCKYERTQGYCEFGVRLRKHHLLGGNVMKIWDTVESAMAFHSRTRLKIARTAGTTAETLKAIGLAVPGSAIGDVLGALKRLGKIDEMDKKDQEAETREHSKVATGSKVAVKVKSEVKVEVESEVESEVKLEVKAETESETELMEVDGGDEGEDSDCFLLD